MNTGDHRLRTFKRLLGVVASTWAMVNADAAELPIALGIEATSPRAAVVALHGIQTNAEWFERLGHALAAQHISLYAVNVPERGMFNPPAAGAQSWEADWVAPLKATASKVHKKTGLPVLLLGTSWGARPVLRAAADADDDDAWCRGVILVAPALKTSADLKFAWRAMVWHKPGSGIFDLPLYPRDYTDDSNFGALKSWLEDTPGTNGHKLVRQATRGHFSQTKALRDEVKARLPSVQAPVLSLFGSGDTLVHLHAADMMLGEVQGGCETRIVKGGTHAMQLDKQRELAGFISDWLGRTVEHKAAPSGTVHLDSRKQYFDCGIDVVQGRSYQFVMNEGQVWKDSRLRSCDPIAGDPTLHKLGAGWLRRVHRDALDRGIVPRYFQPIVTIEKDDRTGILVKPGRTWTASRSGRLYAFANDANWNGARRNNHGFVTFRVVPVE